MTEEEAKTKWCPFVRVAGVDGPDRGAEWHTNRPSVADVESKGFDLCCGSACMAWRWWDKWTSMTEEGNGGDIVLRLSRKEGDARLGFCGLAGKP